MTDELRVPEGLVWYKAQLAEALGVPVPGTWPKDEKILAAEQPEAIGKVLVEALHKHLAPARIVYMFLKDKQKNDRTTLGTAQKASAKIRFLAAADYMIEINWSAWLTLTAEQRIAIVDHELCHCAGKDENGRWSSRDHDVEEFGTIVDRWGLYKDDLKQFAHRVARQLEMLD